MLETVKHCPSCNHAGYNHYISCKDYTVSGETFNIVKCENCQLLFTNPRPVVEDIAGYYKSDEYISHHNKSQSLSDALYKLVRNFTLKAKVNLISKYGKKGSLLDIGCGTGFFLQQAHKSGWKVKGVEPNETARKQAISNDIQVETDLKEYSGQQFDNITLWHVLEHVYDLNQFIEELKNSLTDDGTIFIAVPNSKSFDAQHYKEDWAAYDLPRHLYHFDQHTIKETLKRHDLSIIDTIPMKFDAYYVSLLSESYIKKSVFNYITFLINGMKSNRFASNNNNNYSSLIYIIKKS